ncbi:MAG: hypothetical protein GQ557_02455 [Mycoplasmataceae bacterium]|nr:hypothetical protein [Mycoplasmataceae bacterium]
MQKTIISRIDQIYKTKWMFIILTSFIGFFSLIQIFLFYYLPGFEIQWAWGTNISSDSSNSWLGLLIIFLALFGSCISISGEVMMVRNQKKFLPWIIVGESLLIVYGIFTGIIFTTIIYFLYIVSAIAHKKHWEDESKDHNTMTNEAHIFIIVVTTLYISLALSLTLTGIVNDPAPVLDVLISGFVLIGWFNITRKNKWGYLFFLLTDVLGIIMFIQIGSFVLASSCIIYIFFDASAFAIWNSRTANKHQGINH